MYLFSPSFNFFIFLGLSCFFSFPDRSSASNTSCTHKSGCNKTKNHLYHNDPQSSGRHSRHYHHQLKTPMPTQHSSSIARPTFSSSCMGHNVTQIWCSTKTFTRTIHHHLPHHTSLSTSTSIICTQTVVIIQQLHSKKISHTAMTTPTSKPKKVFMNKSAEQHKTKPKKKRPAATKSHSPEAVAVPKFDYSLPLDSYPIDSNAETESFPNEVGTSPNPELTQSVWSSTSPSPVLTHAPGYTGEAVSGSVSNKSLGIGLGLGIGCVAAIGLAGLLLHSHRRKQQSAEDCEFDSRWRTQSFMSAVAAVVAKLPRSPSQRSQQQLETAEVIAIGTGEGAVEYPIRRPSTNQGPGHQLT